MIGLHVPFSYSAVIIAGAATLLFGGLVGGGVGLFVLLSDRKVFYKGK